LEKWKEELQIEKEVHGKYRSRKHGNEENK
jgi:hypothetical protein